MSKVDLLMRIMDIAQLPQYRETDAAINQLVKDTLLSLTDDEYNELYSQATPTQTQR